MLGEPNLQADNQWEWFDLICVSIERPLPKKLANDLSVGVLQQIADNFEAVILFSTLFEVSGSPRSKPKHRWKLKRTEPDGCICSVIIHVRKNTTADEEEILEKGQGNDKLCSFHPRSADFQNLLMLHGVPGQAQISAGQTFFDSTLCVVTDETLPQSSAQSQVVTATNKRQDTVLGRLEPASPAQDTAKLDRAIHKMASQQESGLIGSTEKQQSFPSVNTCSSFSTHITLPTENSGMYVFGNDEDEQAVQGKRKQRKRKSTFSSSILPRDKMFSGRKSHLSLLNEALQSTCSMSGNDQIQHKRSKILYLTGAPGIGKTAIALEHVYLSMEQIDHVLWLNATSQASLGKCCHDIAVALGLVQGRLSQTHDASRVKFLEWLETRGKTFLLIFDDVSRGNDISPYIPKWGSGSILVTSRYRSWKGLEGTTVEMVEVPAFSRHEAAEFLFHTLFQGKRPDQARDLCIAATRYHASPLILRHVVNWSIRHKISIHYINRFLDSKEASLRLQLRLRYSPIDDIISTKIGALDEIGSQLFEVLCFFDTTGVQDRLLLGAQRSKNLPLEFFPRNNEALSGTLKHLWSASLIEVNEFDKKCSVYRTIQDITRASMDCNTFNDCFQTASILVQAQWPPKRKYGNIINGFWPDFDHLHTHVQSLAQSLVETRHTLIDPNDDFKQLLINHTWSVRTIYS